MYCSELPTHRIVAPPLHGSYTSYVAKRGGDAFASMADSGSILFPNHLKSKRDGVND